MIQVTDLNPGKTFNDGGNIYVALDVLLNKTAMAKMVVKVKARNLRTGAIVELSYKSGEKLDEARLDKKQMQYLYKDGSTYVFMDNETYEQVELDESKLEWEKKFLREEQLVEITYYNDEILGISLPAKVTLRITKCEPGVRGDTARAAQKDAELETGLTIRVPLFIEEGEEVIVRTDTGDYDSRA